MSIYDATSDKNTVDLTHFPISFIKSKNDTLVISSKDSIIDTEIPVQIYRERTELEHSGMFDNGGSHINPTPFFRGYNLIGTGHDLNVPVQFFIDDGKQILYLINYDNDTITEYFLPNSIEQYSYSDSCGELKGLYFRELAKLQNTMLDKKYPDCKISIPINNHWSNTLEHLSWIAKENKYEEIFKQINLSCRDLSKPSCQYDWDGVDFSGMTMIKVHGWFTSCKNCNFNGADLRDSFFEGEDVLTGSTFLGANLEGMSVYQSELEHITYDKDVYDVDKPNPLIATFRKK